MLPQQQQLPQFVSLRRPADKKNSSADIFSTPGTARTTMPRSSSSSTRLKRRKGRRAWSTGRRQSSSTVRFVIYCFPYSKKFSFLVPRRLFPELHPRCLPLPWKTLRAVPRFRGGPVARRAAQPHHTRLHRGGKAGLPRARPQHDLLQADRRDEAIHQDLPGDEAALLPKALSQGAAEERRRKRVREEESRTNYRIVSKQTGKG